MRRVGKLTASTIAAVVSAQLLHADILTINEQPLHRYEWRASTFAASSQSQAAIAVDQEGQIITVWSSKRQQGGRYGVYAQRFSPEGIAIGSETTVNLWTESHQLSPAIATDENGTWIVWQSHGQDGDAGSIIARRFDQSFDGGSEILVNQQWDGDQSNPLVAASADGTAMIVWSALDPATNSPQLRARLVQATGAFLTDEFAVCKDCDDPQTTASVAADPNGSFVVAFGVIDDWMSAIGIHAQRFDAEGKELGDEVEVSGKIKATQIEPAVAVANDGFIVAWLDTESDGEEYGVVARSFDGDGCPRTEPFVVNTTTAGNQTAAAVAVAADGRIAIAWNGTDDDGSGVFGQLFAADGTQVGEEFRLNKHEQGEQALGAATGSQRLSFAPNGSLVGAWNGDGGFDDSSSVNVTMLSQTELQLADNSQGITQQLQPAGSPVLVAQGPSPHVPPVFDRRPRRGGGVREIREGVDIGFTGIINNSWIPVPDPHLAVGPVHVVVITNEAIAFFTKDGNLTFQEELAGPTGFWASVDADDLVFDPEVLYDETSGRFFAIASEGNGPYIILAVSDDSDPNGLWHQYRFDMSSLFNAFADGPNIGVDAEVVYLTANDGALPWIYGAVTIDKASLLAGDPPAQVNIFLIPSGTGSAGMPPVSFDNPPALYLIEHKDEPTNTSVRLIALQDPLESPPNLTEALVTVPSYGPPEQPPQMGTGLHLETGHAGFWSVAYRNGSLWATHHINSDRVLARWYEIAMNGWPDSGDVPTLVQSGEIDPGPGIRTYHSSITVDDNGNAAMTFSRSSPNEFISMSTAYRLNTDPLDTFRPDEIRQTNIGPWTLISRWGDYSAVKVDPSNGRTFWAHHQYAINNNWHTWVQAFTPDLTVAPFDFNAIRGFYDSGTLDDVLASDDNDLCYEPGIVLNPSEAPITLDFFGTLANDSPASLDVTIESSANTVGLELTFSFWNFNTNMWDVVGTATQSLNADTVRTFAGIPADHVEAGTGEVRTRYEVRVVSFIFLFPYLDCVDHVFWSTTN